MKSILTIMALTVACLLAPLPLEAQQPSTPKRNGGQSKTSLTIDLASLPGGKGASVVNRTATVLQEGTRKGIRLDQRPGDGLVWLEEVAFTNGVIEFDVRGKDLLQQSFVGVAFHGTDDQTYEAIYFRPFNFRSADAPRRAHAVQYIAHPTHTWQKLRSEHPDQYEAPLTPAPDPNEWFHVRVNVDAKTIRVFVNGSSQPGLQVKSLSTAQGDKLGLWVGNNSGGDFANLTIRPVP
jgi:hypothetical protein